MLLALLLLLSQQMALAHAVTHIRQPVESGSTTDDGLPDELQCIKCFAFASVGTALSSAALSWFIALDARWSTPAGIVIHPRRSLLRAFDSRAPPLTV